MNHKLARWIAVIAITLAFILPQGLATDGVIINSGTPTTKIFTYTENSTAFGGANKSINATAITQTIAWQAFYGKVLGNITLEDTTGAMFYSWNDIANGTVFASTSNSVDFTTITAQNNCTTDETLTGTGSDKTSLTFTPSNNTMFNIGGITITPGTACTTHTYVNSAKQTTLFEEIILQATGVQSIYATRIENATGFNGQNNNYQLIVPTNTTTNTYYIYAEIN